MEIRIINVAKVKLPWVIEGEKEYVKRLKAWVKLSFVELNLKTGSLPEGEAKRREGEEIIKSIPKGSYFVALDETGTEFSSNSFATKIGQKMSHGTSSITFAIGGPYGFDKGVTERAEMVLSLSKLTFPYQLARLILVEQVYRAYTILNGTPYSK